MVESHDGIGSLQTEDVADRRVRGRVPWNAAGSFVHLRTVVLRHCGPPALQMRLQTCDILDLHHLPRFLHRPIPGELPLRLRPCLFRRTPAQHRAVRLVLHSRDQRRDTKTNSAPAHFRQSNCSPAPIRFVGHPLFAQADFVDGARQIAVPLQRVHGEVEVGVKDEHKTSNGL